MTDKPKIRTIRTVKDEISQLTQYMNIAYTKPVRDLIQKICQENAPKVAELRKELAELEAKKPMPKPRWPENTPESVLKECQDFWFGTAEYSAFRIHCWNDKVICTSYPSGGYSDNGGYHPTSAVFHFISRTEKGMGRDRAKVLAELEGRQSAKVLQQKLDEVSGEKK